MDVVAAGQDGLAAFERSIYQGAAQSTLPGDLDLQLSDPDLAALGLPVRRGGEPGRWKTACCCGRQRRALRDAGLEIGSGNPAKLAFLYSRSCDLAVSAAQAAGDFPAPAVKLAALAGFHGPVSNLSGEPNPLAAGLLEAQRLLDTRLVDAVLLAGAALLSDFAGMPQIAAARVHSGPLNFGLDQAVDGWVLGEGAAAVVLMRQDSAVSGGQRIYALVDAFGWAPRDLPRLKRNLVPTLVSADPIEQSCRLAYEQSIVFTR